MSFDQMKDIARRYQDQFGNLPEIYNPAIDEDPAFYDLLEKAMADGVALTREAVQAEFAELAYEECRAAE